MAKLNRQEQAKLNYMQNGGNIKKAMIDAGYSETYADRNSKYLMGIIGQGIKEAQENIRQEQIKTIEEVQQWWSSIIDNTKESTKDRLKASELLVKSKGGFMDKVEVNGSLNNPFAGMTTEELKKLVGDEY